jgi:hypothetical protein
VGARAPSLVGARRAVTALVGARAQRRAVMGRVGRGRSGKLWAVCAVHTGGAGAVEVGHALLCNWAERRFGPVAVGLSFLFSEYIQILANLKICVGFI